MSKRFASFGGPSVPTTSPVAAQSTNSTPNKSGGKKKANPASPNSRSPRPKFDVSGSSTSVHAPRKAKTQEETEIQSLVRLTLKRVSLELKGWGKTGGKFGLQDAKLMVDQVTELDNSIVSFSSSKLQPTFEVVSQKLDYIRIHRDNIRNASRDMDRSFTMLVKRANIVEQALTEYVRTNGVEASEEIPLWADRTWSLGQFALHIHQILRPLSRFRHTFQILSEKIIAYGLSGGFNSENIRLPESERPKSSRGATVPTFEETRNAMALWATEAAFIEELAKEWSEMCALEVVGWDKKYDLGAYSSDEDEEEMD
ncbi:unnamed protein product [Rhizoctonia solani]|uniref:Uncharacterized protein n=1 Tax=Rhizoctonia solani TaxID=456999 RepID=A0A8H2WF13_9AGAM|nr:unnamed protein product [Rhizoctonia solani]